MLGYGFTNLPIRIVDERIQPVALLGNSDANINLNVGYQPFESIPLFCDDHANMPVLIIDKLIESIPLFGNGNTNIIATIIHELFQSIALLRSVVTLKIILAVNHFALLVAQSTIWHKFTHRALPVLLVSTSALSFIVTAFLVFYVRWCPLLPSYLFAPRTCEEIGEKDQRENRIDSLDFGNELRAPLSDEITPTLKLFQNLNALDASRLNLIACDDLLGQR